MRKVVAVMLGLMLLGPVGCGQTKKKEDKSSESADDDAESSGKKKKKKASAEPDKPKLDPEVEKAIKVLEDPKAETKAVQAATEVVTKAGAKAAPFLVEAWDRQTEDKEDYYMAQLQLLHAAGEMSGTDGLDVLHRGLSASKEKIRGVACQRIGKRAADVVKDEERRKALVALMGPFKDKISECQEALVAVAAERKKRDGE